MYHGTCMLTALMDNGCLKGIMEGLAFYLTFFIVGSPEVWHGNVDAMMDT